MRHYKWPHDFWRRMGRNEFYAWLAQASRETQGEKADDPNSWRGVDQDKWWQDAREKRQRILQR